VFGSQVPETVGVEVERIDPENGERIVGASGGMRSCTIIVTIPVFDNNHPVSIN
jgi:hypothetical protein